MYFWNVKQLALDIKNDEVTQTQERDYYIFYTFIISVTFYVTMIEENTESLIFSDAIEILSIIITIIWILINFKANNGDQGKNFVSRSIMLGLPLVVRMVVMALIVFVVFLIGFVIFFGEDLAINYMDYTAEVLIFIFYINFYFQMNKQFKFIIFLSAED